MSQTPDGLLRSSTCSGGRTPLTCEWHGDLAVIRGQTALLLTFIRRVFVVVTSMRGARKILLSADIDV
jgi:hypothetical protein